MPFIWSLLSSLGDAFPVSTLDFGCRSEGGFGRRLYNRVLIRGPFISCHLMMTDDSNVLIVVYVYILLWLQLMNLHRSVKVCMSCCTWRDLCGREELHCQQSNDRCLNSDDDFELLLIAGAWCPAFIQPCSEKPRNRQKSRSVCYPKIKVVHAASATCGASL